MESTLSVSKGVFVLKNPSAIKEKSAKQNRRRSPAGPRNSIIDPAILAQPWYRVYWENWSAVHAQIEELQGTLYEKILRNIVDFIAQSYESGRSLAAKKVSVIPTAVILTGINQSDHLAQFQVLAAKVVNNVSSHVVMLLARDCPTVKAAIESMISSFVEEVTYRPDDDDDVDEIRGKKVFRKTQLTMSVLHSWYLDKYRHGSKQKLVVVLPDFELFNAQVLPDLIMILSAHIPELPFVLIFGVATSISTIYDVLPYNILRNIQLKIYQSEAATSNLNQVLEQVLLKVPFHLSGQAFQFLLDIFIFYDFSLNGLIHGFKYLMLEHYSRGNVYSLCTAYTDGVEQAIHRLTSADIGQMRRLMSFRPYVESLENSEEVIAVLTQDDYLKRKLPKLLRDVHEYLFNMHLSLEILRIFVGDLPKSPLGKQIRELYPLCMANDISTMTDYKECIKLIMFHSKSEILAKLDKCLHIIHAHQQAIKKTNELAFKLSKNLKDMEQRFENFNQLLTKAGLECATLETVTKPDNGTLLSVKMNRHQMMDKLLQAAKHRPAVQVSTYMRTLQDFVDYFENTIVRVNLRPLPEAPPLIELFVFTDTTTARQHLLGTPRASIHTALNNPNYYLQCQCCDISNNSLTLLPSMPALSVAYKLHLECGKMINLFDWLQAFKTVIANQSATDEDDGYDVVDPKIQAQFTRAVAELQFIGFIKASKRKTDHVSRLAW